MVTKLSRRRLLQAAGATAATTALPLPWYSRRARAQGGPLVYWGHNYPTRVRICDEILVPGFEQESGVDVQHENFETNQLGLKILTSWAGGAGIPDLVSIGVNNLPNYVYRDMIAPVDPEAFGFASQEEVIDAFEPGALDSFIVDGTLYGMPMDIASISMYYRRDFFKDAGLDPDTPPKTWAEVTEMGKKLMQRDANGNVTRAGWGWLARSTSSHFYYWGTLLPQKGVDFLNKEGTGNGFSNEAGMAAFQYLYDTFHGPDQITALGLAPTISPVDDFGSGRFAMVNSGMWLAPAVEQKYPDVTFKDGVYGVAQLPQFENGTPATRLNPWVYMVSKQSNRQREAWELVSYLMQRPESRALWFSEAQFVLPWKGYRSMPELQAIPYASTFLDDLAIGVPLPNTPHFNELATMVAQAYDRISANGEKPEVVVPDLAGEIDFLVG